MTDQYFPMITPEGANVADDLDELDDLDVLIGERTDNQTECMHMGSCEHRPPRKPVTLHPTPLPPNGGGAAEQCVGYLGGVSPPPRCCLQAGHDGRHSFDCRTGRFESPEEREAVLKSMAESKAGAPAVSHDEVRAKLRERGLREMANGDLISDEQLQEMIAERFSEEMQERDDPSLDVPIPYALKTTKGKRDWSLMPLEVIGHGIDALQWAIERTDNPYTRDSWRDVADWVKVFPSAELRHLTEIKTGQERDPDSGLLHAAHNLASAMIIMARALEDAKGGK